jgi:type I restriction enzyme S subunit
MSYFDKIIAELSRAGVRHVALSEVASYSSTRVDAFELDETSFVGVDNLVAGKGGRVDASYLPNTERLTGYEPGDILLGNIRPYLKKIWRASNAGGCSGDVLAIRIHPAFQGELDSEFLYYLLSSDGFFDYNMQHAKGAKMPRGDKTAILNFRIPVPPLEVQREIVRILDQFTQLEAELEAELEARRRQFAFYRESLLTSDTSCESLPLGELAEFKYGFTAIAANSGRYRFLRITDITASGKLSPTKPKYVDIDDSSRAYIVEPGDLLMARTGATFGKTMLATRDEPSVYASFLIRIRFTRSEILPAYYWHFAQSNLYWSQANAMVSTGGQPQFNANVLKLVQVPVPPLEEQSRIVELLDKFDSLANDLTIGLPAELAARRKQYEYYRDRLLTFEEAAA